MGEYVKLPEYKGAPGPVTIMDATGNVIEVKDVSMRLPYEFWKCKRHRKLSCPACAELSRKSPEGSKLTCEVDGVGVESPLWAVGYLAPRDAGEDHD